MQLAAGTIVAELEDIRLFARITGTLPEGSVFRRPPFPELQPVVSQVRPCLEHARCKNLVRCFLEVVGKNLQLLPTAGISVLREIGQAIREVVDHVA